MPCKARIYSQNQNPKNKITDESLRKSAGKILLLSYEDNIMERQRLTGTGGRFF